MENEANQHRLFKKKSNLMVDWIFIVRSDCWDLIISQKMSNSGIMKFHLEDKFDI